jgi:TonB family protein
MLNKKIGFVLMLLISQMTWGQENKIHWLTVNELEEAVKASPKKIMIDVYTQWCGPCKMMANQTFTHPDVVRYMNENYHCVKFDAESGDPVTFKGKEYKNPDFKPGAGGRNSVHQLTFDLGVNAYPTLIFFDENLNPITPVTGFQSVENFELYAKLFGSNAYREITSKESWEQYQRNFVRTWGMAPAPAPAAVQEKKVGPSPLLMEIPNDTLDIPYPPMEDIPVVPAESVMPAPDDAVFEMVEQMPIFTAGDINQYIAKNVKYPTDAIENEIQGKVYLSFVVDKSGKVRDVIILRGIRGGGSLEKEALRVIKSLPNFSPGLQNGKAVNVKMTIPINFLLK